VTKSDRGAIVTGRRAHVVEVDAMGLIWIKASYSNAGTDCVEMTAAMGRILVRRTRYRPAPVLSLPSAAWQQVVDMVRRST
jgi:hypothetical protein